MTQPRNPGSPPSRAKSVEPTHWLVIQPPVPTSQQQLMKLLRHCWLLLALTSLARLAQAQPQTQAQPRPQQAAAGRLSPDQTIVRGVRDQLFALPEVRLANARVAARINRQLSCPLHLRPAHRPPGNPEPTGDRYAGPAPGVAAGR